MPPAILNASFGPQHFAWYGAVSGGVHSARFALSHGDRFVSPENSGSPVGKRQWVAELLHTPIGFRVGGDG
jgi:hypothetical protein